MNKKPVEKKKSSEKKMSGEKTEKKHSESSTKHKSIKPKKDIEIIDEGPVYICDDCHAMLHVPDERIEEEEVKEEDEEGTYNLLVSSYVCPRCDGKIIVSEEEIVEEEDETPVKSTKK